MKKIGIRDIKGKEVMGGDIVKSEQMYDELAEVKFLLKQLVFRRAQ